VIVRLDDSVTGIVVIVATYVVERMLGSVGDEEWKARRIRRLVAMTHSLYTGPVAVRSLEGLHIHREGALEHLRSL